VTGPVVPAGGYGLPAAPPVTVAKRTAVAAYAAGRVRPE
jgi:hypothetical protein